MLSGGEVSRGTYIPAWCWDGALAPPPGGVPGSLVLFPGWIQAGSWTPGSHSPWHHPATYTCLSHASPSSPWLEDGFRSMGSSSPAARAFWRGLHSSALTLTVLTFWSCHGPGGCHRVPATLTPHWGSGAPTQGPQSPSQSGNSCCSPVQADRALSPQCSPPAPGPTRHIPLLLHHSQAGHSQSPLGPWPSWVSACPQVPAMCPHGR